MSREVPWDEDAHCDVCGEPGAFNFMGDYICEKCISLGKDFGSSPEHVIKRWQVIHPSGDPCDFRPGISEQALAVGRGRLNGMTPIDLRAWQTRLGISQPEAARQTKTPLETYRSYIQGKRKIPDNFALLCWYRETFGPAPPP